jgi:hypothetical protein
MISLGLALLLAQPQPGYAERIFSPREAVEAAAGAEGKPVGGIFDLRVRATGATAHHVYLNSERDYRDQPNLSVAISRGAAAEIARRKGTTGHRLFENRSVRVYGAAQRVRVDFLDPSGRPTGKYYYQTHVRVNDPRQLQLVD